MQLSPQERSFFELLAREPGKAVPTVDLLNASDSDGDNGVAKVVIHRIKRKLGVTIEQHRGRHGSGDGGAYSLVKAL